MSVTSRSTSLSVTKPGKVYATATVGADIGDEEVIGLQIELGHARMQLMAESDEIRKLEILVEAAIAASQGMTESQLIRGLRASLDALRSELEIAVTEKQRLAVTTASEINRLRDMLKLMTEQILYLSDEPPRIQMFHDYESVESAFALGIPKHLALRPRSTEDSMRKSSAARMEHTRTKRSIRDTSDFPRVSVKCIDMITLETGDGVHFPDPYAVVDIIYKGYIYHNPEEVKSDAVCDDPDTIPANWEKFTPDDGREHVYSTNLGVGNNIIGLETAVLAMTLGEKCRIFVPSRLGYGAGTAEGWIKPHSHLIFDLKLKVIHSAEPPKTV